MFIRNLQKFRDKSCNQVKFLALSIIAINFIESFLYATGQSKPCH